ncbi:cellulose biosynthesis protein BcsN [Ensifer soli]|uniref:cellulose biosynthesis protein BcsN n=1 Tax=Ciceribacter sp. sgz301302 TaxID=3342379 RepID=UPI0035B8FA9B
MADSIRPILVLALPLALGACSSVVDDPYLKTVSITPDAPALATAVPASQALASLPLLDGRVSEVRQTLGSGHVEQVIVLPNDTDLAGENAVYVVAGRADAGNRILRAPTERELRAEMAERLPGLRMSLSTVIADNPQGGFGYATGPAGRSGSCVYAWQLVRGKGGIGAGYPAQVRLRFCHPTIGEDRIAGLMTSLTLRPVTDATLRALRAGPATAAFSAPTATFGGGPSLTAEDERALSGGPVALKRADLAVAEPVVRRKRKPIAPAAAEPEPAETVEAASPAVAAAEGEPAIRHAVKIPMPGEATPATGAEEAAATPKAVAATKGNLAPKGTFVPLPAE